MLFGNHGGHYPGRWKLWYVSAAVQEPTTNNRGGRSKQNTIWARKLRFSIDRDDTDFWLLTLLFNVLVVVGVVFVGVLVNGCRHCIHHRCVPHNDDQRAQHHHSAV
jgi:hypothetical protein